jgi:hypothetical protein
MSARPFGASLTCLVALALNGGTMIGCAMGSGSAPAAETSSTMAQKLSSKLSPKAKKAFMVGGEQSVTGLVTVAPTVDRADLERQIRALGGDVQSFDPITSLAAVELPVSKLGALADLDGVVYIEIGETYRP